MPEITDEKMAELVAKFKEFLRGRYYKELVKASNENTALVVDYKEMEKFNPEFCAWLTEDPETMFKVSAEAVRQTEMGSLGETEDVSGGEEKEPDYVTVRFAGLPEIINIRDIRAKQLDHFIATEGIVRRASDIRPEILETGWECMECGSIVNQETKGSFVMKPFQCSCGGRSFKQAGKKMIDARWITIEEPFELTEGEQPSQLTVFLSRDLVAKDKRSMTDPGNRLRICGVLRDIPKGKFNSAKLDFYLDSNSLEQTEIGWEKVEISKEDEEEIKKLSEDPDIYEKLVDSLAPSIYGCRDIKEAIILQMFSGVPRVFKDKMKLRGEIHILMIGDPACLIGDERIFLGDGTTAKIQNLGNRHMQNICIPVRVKGHVSDMATTFHVYNNQPIIEMVTESGKSLKGSYNQPVLIVEGRKRVWKRLDELKTGDRVAVITGIKCRKVSLVSTAWTKLDRRLGPRFRGRIPDKWDTKLGAFIGYLLGDGYVRENKGEIVAIVNKDESDLVEILAGFIRDIFGMEPILETRKSPDHEYNGRTIMSKNELHYIILRSKDIAGNLGFLRFKRIPDPIFLSPDSVVKEFLKWLFQADGTVFCKGRGRRAIQLKQKEIELLRDVQVLLLRFGIHSRIYDNNLTIRRGNDIIKFSKHIGFASRNKKDKLLKLSADAVDTKRVRRQCSEKIVRINKLNGTQTVYDIEVPKSKRFIANGIVVHNSGKSQLLKIVPNMIPRGRYVSGKGVTSAGLTCTVTKDEQFMGGWVLEAGAMVLSNKGMLAIDEFEKMEETDQVAMHEALEQGCYDYSTEVILGDGTVVPIGQLVEGFTEGCMNDPAIKCIKEKGIKLMSVDLDNNIIKPSKASFVSKHTENHIYGIKLFTGQELKITASHPVFTVRDGALILCKASELREDDWIPLPSSINIEGKSQKLVIPTGLKGRKKIRLPESTSPEFCEWLGFIAGEGCAEVNRGRRCGICFTNSDPEILSRYKKITSSLFSVQNYSQTKTGRTMLRLISKDLYDFAISNADGILNKSYGKKLPSWVFKITKEECASLLRGLFDSEGSINYKYGTVTFSTTSPELAKQVQHLCLRLGIFAGMYNDASMKGNRKRPAYKIQISGKKNISAFSEHVGFRGRRAKKLFALLKKKTVSSRQDHLPNMMQSLEHVKKALRLSDCACAGYVMYGNRKRDFITKSLASKVIGRFDSRIKEVEASVCALEKEMPYSILLHERNVLRISRSEIARRLGISEQNLWYREAVKKDENWIERSKNETLKIAKEMLSVCQEVAKFRHLLEAPLEWVRIKKIETKEGKVWVYDVQMNPTHTFIGNGILCHNSVSIAKASIVATLPAQTSVLAGGNPKFSRFDAYRSITEQINIPETLLSRFDLKFVLRDIPDAEKDKLIVDHVLKAREGDESGIEPVIDPLLIRKYISYTKKICKPKLTKETGKLLKDYYIKTRKKAEGGNAPVPITLRQFESLIRLSEASAKIQLSDVVRKEDAQRAIKLMEFSLMQLGYDVATGRIDVDKSEGATSFTERSRIRLLIEIINNLSATKKEIALKELYEAAKKEGVMEHDLDSLVEKLKREGMLFEPNPGFVQKV